MTFIIAPFPIIGHFECSLFKNATSHLTADIIKNQAQCLECNLFDPACCMLSCFVVDHFKKRRVPELEGT
jgi:hypothetical protein